MRRIFSKGNLYINDNVGISSNVSISNVSNVSISSNGVLGTHGSYSIYEYEYRSVQALLYQLLPAVSKLPAKSCPLKKSQPHLLFLAPY